MKAISNEILLKQLNWRYATKKFDPSNKISEADIKTLEEVLHLSPSSYGLQPWKFIFVQNAEIRKKLRAVSWNQPQVEECSHLIVFTTLKKVSEDYIRHFIARMAEVRSIDPESLDSYQAAMIGDVVKGPRSNIVPTWTQRQSYIAMGNLMQAAALMEIDTCALEGLDPAQYDEILNLTSTDYAAFAAVALGYRSENDAFQHLKKVRFKIEEVVEWIK